MVTELTDILRQSRDGDSRATNKLFPMVYEELRGIAAARMSRERHEQTLSATALVNEAYLRLVGSNNDLEWDNRGHFFSAAAEAMRRILVERARARKAQKRNHRRETLDLDLLVEPETPVDIDLILDINSGIERLMTEDPQVARFLTLRLFAGLSVSQSGRLLGMSRASAYRMWSYAQIWFLAFSRAASGCDRT